jgi:hypothetical protein
LVHVNPPFLHPNPKLLSVSPFLFISLSLFPSDVSHFLQCPKRFEQFNAITWNVRRISFRRVQLFTLIFSCNKMKCCYTFLVRR